MQALRLHFAWCCVCVLCLWCVLREEMKDVVMMKAGSKDNNGQRSAHPDATPATTASSWRNAVVLATCRDNPL